jgi:hypothetical protein
MGRKAEERKVGRSEERRTSCGTTEIRNNRNYAESIGHGAEGYWWAKAMGDRLWAIGDRRWAMGTGNMKATNIQYRIGLL